jgi:predicted Rossmann fold flavoprotein
VPLVLDPAMFHATLAGISLEVELSTFADGKRIDRRTGSLLWTHFGVSGPVVMDASRHWVIANESGREARVQCNLIPPDDFSTAERWLVDVASSRPKASVVTALTARLPERVAAAVLGHVGIDQATPGGQLSRESRRQLVHALTALPLRVRQYRGWNYAEVTAGGVPLSEVDYRTMESRKVPGLYLAGEILDCDGRIGGFNFQWAWATGYLAGKAAVAESARP